MPSDVAGPFKRRLESGAPLIGTWLKTPSAIVTEILAGTDLDLLCVDAEHAPFDRASIDACIMAARAQGMPLLVRPATGAPHHTLQALDAGADGVLIPHVRTAGEAASAVAAAHYGPGGRGYAGSTRAAGYTRRTMAQTIAAAAAETVVIAQIEDAQALDALDGIACTAGLDALFIGRADLAVSLGLRNAAAPEVVAAVERVAAAARTAGKICGTFLSDLEELPFWRERGVSLFLLESDQVFLMAGAASLVTRCKARLG